MFLSFCGSKHKFFLINQKILMCRFTEIVVCILLSNYFFQKFLWYLPEILNANCIFPGWREWMVLYKEEWELLVLLGRTVGDLFVCLFVCFLTSYITVRIWKFPISYPKEQWWLNSDQNTFLQSFTTVFWTHSWLQPAKENHDIGSEEKLMKHYHFYLSRYRNLQ